MNFLNSKPRKQLKGTFGHLHSQNSGQILSIDGTISNSSSDHRRRSARHDADVEDEFNSASVTSVKDSGIEADRDQGNNRGFMYDLNLYDDEDVGHGHYGHMLDDELPSGLVDIEGCLIDGDLRFGQDEDDEDVNRERESSSPILMSESASSATAPTLTQAETHDQSHQSTFTARLKRKFTRTPNLAMISKSLNGSKMPSFQSGSIDGFGSEYRKHVGGAAKGKGTKSKFNVKKTLNLDDPGDFNIYPYRDRDRDRDRKDSTYTSSTNTSLTITQHYYPEGGWGWTVLLAALLTHVLLCGLALCSGIVVLNVTKVFYVGEEEAGERVEIVRAGWLGALSIGVSLFFSPIWVSICKRKSTRLAAVFGGLVASLGCLFTSFASQFHQLFFSYGGFIGVGVGLTRDASSLMVGQYFKRKRELVEIVVVSGSGLGIVVMSASIHSAISSLGWRLGLQAITGALFLTFFLGTCYRSASLYHPQRRAILHLKNQKRKVKEKEKREDKPPFLDLSCLRSKTLQILLLSSAFISFGINTPLFYLALEHNHEMKRAGADYNNTGESNEYSLVLLHAAVGISWIVGCCVFGLMILQKNAECRVSKQYLCQMASVICGLSMLALCAVEGLNGLLIFACIYGFSLGSYNYILKVYTYDRVRARHFPRAWSFIQSAQAIPLVIGVPLSGYLNVHVGWKSGYYLAALSVIIGSLFLFLTDVRKRRLSRRKTMSASMKTCETLESAQSPKARRLSFAFPIEQMSPQSKHDSNNGEMHGSLDPALLAKELTCISEEGIADMDFQDIYFDEWAEYFGADCITSCNKVENCLVSEFDPDYPMLLERRSRRWSAARPPSLGPLHQHGPGGVAAAIAGGVVGLGFIGQNLQAHVGSPSQAQPQSQAAAVQSDNISPNSCSGKSSGSSDGHKVIMSAPREIPSFRNRPRMSVSGGPQRTITVIDEAEASM